MFPTAVAGLAARVYVTLMLALPVFAPPLHGQVPSKTVWQGVYTTSQADRGRRQFETHCVFCHGDDPSSGSGAALAGERFMQAWSEDSLASLFNNIRNTMPRGLPRSLSDAAYVDIVAYILHKNGFPPGADDLDVAGLAGIRVEHRDGPNRVPDFSLVRVVGCLTRGPAGQWLVIDGGEPVRTRNPEPSNEAELADSKATPPGAHTFELMNVFPTPESHDSHRVEVRGLLIRSPDVDRLNVTSLRPISAPCGG
jgi:mono/diheme cytochrome c family protein